MEEKAMKSVSRRKHLATLLALAWAASAAPSRAQTDGSVLSAVSVLPVASVVLASESAAAVAQASLLLAAAGATLVVRAIEATVRGTVYVLERVSDGARMSLVVAGKLAGAASVTVGTAVQLSVIAAGTVLSVAGEAIAFVPNAVGQALLHSRKVGN
jgi:hypothetical protein